MTALHLIRHVTRRLRGKRFFYKDTFRAHSENFNRVQHAVVLYYAFTFLYGISEAGWEWPDLLESQFFEVLWPFVLFKSWIITIFIPLGFGSWIIGSILCVLRPQMRWARWLPAIGIFTIVGLRNSDGHYGHNTHALLWITMVLAFLPSLGRGKSPSRQQRHGFIQVYWAAQFVICVFYIMTGVWKVRSLVECAVIPGVQCELSHWVLSNIGAQEIISYRAYAPLSWVLFEYPWLAFFSYMGTIWIHGFSLHFAMRPNLHTLFGFLRVIFHLGTLALFGINFSSFTWPIVLIFLLSPFHRDGETLMKMLAELPPLDILIRKIRPRPS